MMINAIKKIIANEKLQDTLELIAKLLFLLYTMLGFNSIIYGHKIISFAMWAAFLFCGAAIGWRALKFKKYHKFPGLIFLLLFLVSHIISSLLNFQYDIKSNVILLIYLTVYFLLFYVYPSDKEPKKVRREFHIVSIFFIAYSVVSSITGLSMMLNGYYFVDLVGADNYEVVSGFVWGRLWGVFLDPNRSSVILLSAICLILYFISICEKKIFKAFLSVLIIPLFLHIVFADSRTAIVSIFGGAFVGIVFYLIKGSNTKAVIVIRNTAICIVLPLILALSPLLVKNSYNYYVSKTAEEITEATETLQSQNDETTVAEEVLSADVETATVISEENTSTAGIAAEEQTTAAAEEPTTEKKVLQEIERNYDMSGDISNRRFDIWKSAIEVFLTKPVFGTSFNGITPYAADNLPDTYIVNNEQTDFANFHNEILNVLVSQGVVGFVICMAVVFTVVIFLIKKIKHIDTRSRKTVSLLLAALCCMICAAMFISAMFYSFTPTTPMFWMCLGYMVYLLKNSDKKEEKTELISDEL